MVDVVPATLAGADSAVAAFIVLPPNVKVGTDADVSPGGSLGNALLSWLLAAGAMQANRLLGAPAADGAAAGAGAADGIGNNAPERVMAAAGAAANGFAAGASAKAAAVKPDKALEA